MKWEDVFEKHAFEFIFGLYIEISELDDDQCLLKQAHKAYKVISDDQEKLSAKIHIKVLRYRIRNRASNLKRRRDQFMTKIKKKLTKEDKRKKLFIRLRRLDKEIEENKILYEKREKIVLKLHELGRGCFEYKNHTLTVLNNFENQNVVYRPAAVKMLDASIKEKKKSKVKGSKVKKAKKKTVEDKALKKSVKGSKKKVKKVK